VNYLFVGEKLNLGYILIQRYLFGSRPITPATKEPSRLVVICMADSQPYFCPSTVVASSSADGVDQCLALLGAVARGEDVASNLFSAVAIIRHGRQNRGTAGRINREQRGRLNVASVAAQQGAKAHLPVEYDRASLNVGLWAVAYQIMIWAESSETTASRDPDDVLDFDEVARFFQNEMENIALYESTAARAQRRRSLARSA
jgi:hypothetical protein